MGTTVRGALVCTGDSTRTNVSMENFVKVNDALACDLQCQTLKTEFAENVRFPLSPRHPFVCTTYPLIARIDTRFISRGTSLRGLFAQAVNLLRSQLGIVAKDAQMLVCRFGKDAQRQAEAQAMEISLLRRELASAQVRCHQETMVSAATKIQLDGAKDSLETMRAINSSLKRYVSMEKRVGREMVAENGVLRREMASFEETVGRQAGMLEERQRMIDGLEEKVRGLEAGLRAKVMDLEVEKEAAVRLRAEAEEAVRQAAAGVGTQKEDRASVISSLLKKVEFESEKELVQYVKSRDAQERQVERLERRVGEMEDAKNEEVMLRKETEKIVRQQKKQIVALEKQVVSLEKQLNGGGGKTKKRALSGSKEGGDAEIKVLDKQPKKTKKTIVKSVEVDVDGTDDVSVWNPDSCRDSHQETAERVEDVGADGMMGGGVGVISETQTGGDDADKENPKSGTTTTNISAAGAGTKRRLMSISSQGRNALGPQSGAVRGPLMLGVTRKTGATASTGFFIPRLQQQKKPDGQNSDQ